MEIQLHNTGIGRLQEFGDIITIRCELERGQNKALYFVSKTHGVGKKKKRSVDYDKNILKLLFYLLLPLSKKK